MKQSNKLEKDTEQFYQLNLSYYLVLVIDHHSLLSDFLYELNPKYRYEF